MSWLKNRSIGVKLSILAAIPLILLVAVTAFNYFSSGKVNEAYEYSYGNFSVPSANFGVYRAHVQGTTKDVLEIILLDDPVKMKTVKDDLAYRRAAATSIAQEYQKTDMGAKEKDLMSKINQFSSDFRRIQDRVSELGSNNISDAEAMDVYFNELEPITQQYNGAILELSEYLASQAVAEQKEADRYSIEAANTGVAIAIAAIIITLFLSFYISRLITKPVNAMKEKIARFAAGDLSVDFKIDGRDAIAQMGDELEKMAATLREVMNTVKEAGRHISESAQDFSAMAEQTNASAEEFKSNVDEMNANLSNLASASEEVNASVEEVAAGAQTTAEKGTDIARKVDNAMSAGDAGMHAVRSVVDGISRVAESSAASASAVLELGERTKQIQNFVSQIGSIADQTNLLALNAAIEAARAGEAGRGFAVVAEEVRKLAEDSNVAAKSIADLASQITSDLDKIVGYAQKNTSDSSDAKELSAKTESAISNMTNYLQDIASSTQDLAAVAEEQAASSAEIAEAVQSMSEKISNTANASENIRIGVAEVAAASGKVAEGSENLSGLSSNLQSELSYFTVKELDNDRMLLQTVR
ncbi:methyl-accepting chemotaxis sensory transducer [Synergistales bacterium]|nr:methyl-accepting chemotaxis sensory transducer [Synergistales bacterium]